MTNKLRPSNQELEKGLSPHIIKKASTQIDFLNWHNELFSTLIPDDAYYYLAQRLERKKVYKFQNELKLKRKKLKNWRLIDEAAFEGNIKKFRFALPYWFQSCTNMKPIRL